MGACRSHQHPHRWVQRNSRSVFRGRDVTRGGLLLDRLLPLGKLLVRLGAVLGILQRSPDQFFKRSADESVDVALIENLIAERKAARDSRDWARADAML